MSEQKSITLRFLNQYGHTDVSQLLEEAVKTIVKECLEKSKNAFINNRIFQFSPEADRDPVALMKDTIRLKEMLKEGENVVVTITGQIVGG